MKVFGINDEAGFINRVNVVQGFKKFRNLNMRDDESLEANNKENSIARPLPIKKMEYKHFERQY